MNKTREKSSYFNNKIILITGGTGSWGQALTSQLLEEFNPKEIRIFSRGEYKQVDMQRKFHNHPKLKYIIGDVRDKSAIIGATRNVDFLFHLSALKHIPVCEDNQWQTVLTNIYGTQNVIEAAIFQDVEKVIGVSTDKAVEPYNFYGVTKACGEKLLISANRILDHNTRFFCIRSGNVIGTSGSMIPFFREQITRNNEILLTHENMTRFLIETKEAIRQIILTTIMAQGGEIFVLRLPAATNETVVKTMIKMYGNNKTRIRKIGIRAGEKMDEVLISKHEAANTREINDKLYVILPQYIESKLLSKYKKYKPVRFAEYTSKNTERLTSAQLEKLLQKEK